MANLVKYNIASTNAFVTLLTSAQLAVANNTLTAASSTILNSTGVHTYMDCELTVGAASTFSAGGYATLYIVPSADGTNFATSDRATMQRATTFQVSTGATPFFRMYRGPVLIPPADYQLIVDNQTGQTWSTTNGALTLKILTYEVTTNG